MPLFQDELNLEKIASIRHKIAKQNSAFSDKKYLDSLFLPSRIIGREKQAEQLLRHLMSLKDGLLVPFISVFGRSGSGKSTILRLVCQGVEDIAVTAFVNLRKSKSVFGCANSILFELGGIPLKSGDGLAGIVDAIEEKIHNTLTSKGRRFFVLILDEYDVIFSDRRGNPSDFVYKLLRIAENLRDDELWLCVVAISNSAVSDLDLDDRVKSRIGSNCVFFKPYKKDDIVAILHDRADKAFSITISDEILEYCADLSSADHGDARRALDLLRVAGELCDGTVITKADVDNGSSQIQDDRIDEVLKESSSRFKRIFVSLARISFITGQRWHSTSTVYKQYCKFFAKEDEHLSYRRAFDILCELEQTGLVVSKTASAGRNGYSKLYMLTVPPDVVKQLSEKGWERWVKIRNLRFEMLHNPKYNGSSYMAKLAQYQDKKRWRQISGLD